MARERSGARQFRLRTYVQTFCLATHTGALSYPAPEKNKKIFSKNLRKTLDKPPHLWYNKGTKREEVPAMLNWEYEEHYEELMEVAHEVLEAQAE